MSQKIWSNTKQESSWQQHGTPICLQIQGFDGAFQPPQSTFPKQCCHQIPFAHGGYTSIHTSRSHLFLLNLSYLGQCKGYAGIY